MLPAADEHLSTPKQTEVSNGLRQQLRKAASLQTVDKLKVLVEETLNWTTAEIDDPADNKSALHMAAWYGRLDNVRYLVETVGCDVNTFCRSKFAYGKTAIFFAITRNHNEVVNYLLDKGAKVTIVNNKGQSVRSLAVSHLNATVMAKLCAIEQAQQSQDHQQQNQSQQRDFEDGPWWNFRKSHSDNLEYGDLDPRFLDRPLKPTDVVSEFAVNLTSRETRKGGFERRNPTAKKPTKQKKMVTANTKKPSKRLTESEFEDLDKAWKTVRQLLQANDESIHTSAEQQVVAEDDYQQFASSMLAIVRLQEQQRTPWLPETVSSLCSLCSDVTRIDYMIHRMLRPSIPSGQQQCEQQLSKRERKLLNKILKKMHMSVDDNSIKPTQISKPAVVKPKQCSAKPSFNLRSDICSHLQNLHMHDLQQAQENEHPETDILKLPDDPIWINTETDLRALQTELEETSCAKIVGLDSEWYNPGSGMKLATLQLAYKETTISAYVIDMMAESTEYMKAVREFVIWLFNESTYYTVGFAFTSDIKLLSAFAGTKLKPASLDLQKMTRRFKKDVPGLKNCVARFSSVPLSKTEQCSDWTRRPLTKSQLDYAGLDAAILLILLAEYQRENESPQRILNNQYR